MSNKDLRAIVVQDFTQRFGAPPAFVVRAPGRVNLIGEHTDYNDGFVMPMAIERATWIALRPRTDGQVILHSLDHGQTGEFEAANPERTKMSWIEYPKSVAFALREAGYVLNGWEGVTICDVPMGGGLSSSASYELAVARAFCAVTGWAWDAPKMAVICQRAENEWVGVKCGIMDQMISAVGEPDRAVLIDCRDLSRKAAPLPAGTLVVIMDTATRRGLVDSAYNERRSQCQEASRHFGVKALREVDLATFEKRSGELAETVRKRARHVISENARTVEAAEAMAKGDAARLGVLMNASHDSLRDDFAVTNRELDVIVDIARKTAGCIGARMTGAGFGGCAVALVKAAEVEKFARDLAAAYKQATGLDPAIYVTRATAGASLEA